MWEKPYEHSTHLTLTRGQRGIRDRLCIYLPPPAGRLSVLFSKTRYCCTDNCCVGRAGRKAIQRSHVATKKSNSKRVFNGSSRLTTDDFARISATTSNRTNTTVRFPSAIVARGLRAKGEGLSTQAMPSTVRKCGPFSAKFQEQRLCVRTPGCRLSSPPQANLLSTYQKPFEEPS